MYIYVNRTYKIVKKAVTSKPKSYIMYLNTKYKALCILYVI